MKLPITWILFASFAVLLLLVFLLALERRWLARFKHGFLITMMLALGGIGLAASVLIGVWGYDAARKIVSDQTVQELGIVGHIIESEIAEELAQALAQLEGLAKNVPADLLSKRGSLISPEFEELERVNPRFLHITLADHEGKIVLNVGAKGKSEPINRVAIAYCLEGRPFASDPYYSEVFGKNVLLLGIPVKTSSGEAAGAINARFDIQDLLSRVIVSACFGKTGYSAIVNSDGRLLAHPDPQRLNEEISSYSAVQAGLRGEWGSTVQVNSQGREMLYFYRPLNSPGTVNSKPMVLLIEMSDAEATMAVRNLRSQFAMGTAFFAAICLLIAWVIAHSLRKPLSSILNAVLRIEKGDLSSRIEHPGCDEFGQLAASLNEMVKGLEEKERVKELFGRYVTTQVSEEVLKGKVSLGGQSRCVTMLFSDIRDFTAMAEKMTPTQVVTFLNDYFSEMVEAVFEQGGVLDKFLGDGMMAVFGSFGDTPDHARRAVMAALRMKALLGKINGERVMNGQTPINIGIGIHTDEVIVGNIGSRRRLEYTVIGDGVNTSARVESLNKEFGTTILITGATYDNIKDQFECRQMPAAPLKGKTRSLTFHEVLSIRGNS